MQYIKDILFKISPTLFGGLFAIRSRRVAEQVESREQLDELSRKLIDELGMSVQNGPFSGMKLPPAMKDRHIGPFLIGSYESCLHDTLCSLGGNKYETILDVGSSFGYYACGLARMFTQAHVYAFDTDPWARRQVQRMASINEVENISVRTACTPQTILETSGVHNLVLSDCEGYEHQLFTRLVVDALSQSDVIIEVHPAGDVQGREQL